MAEQPGVVITRRGAALHILLDRPRALNALDLAMIDAIHPALDAAAADPDVALVLIRGAGGRAFCAGGDVRAVALALKDSDNDLPRIFFEREYALNLAIHRFPKPYVALIEGVSMGGGVGLSAHGTRRVCADTLTMAMPETGIGLFPDVGATWLLTRWPGATGMFCGLTGTRLDAADAVHVGYATEIVPAAAMDAVEAALIDAAPATAEAVDAVVAPFAIAPGPSKLAAAREAIDRIFALGSLEAVLAALAAEPGDWAAQVRADLAKKSPTSLALVFEQLTRGRGLDIAAALRLEHRLTQFCMTADFAEGIRALLIDKDQQPAWRPARLEDVDRAAIAALFA